MKKPSLSETINDLKAYLTDIDSRAKKLDKSQKEELRDIIRSILILLVSLTKASNLGKLFINFLR